MDVKPRRRLQSPATALQPRDDSGDSRAKTSVVGPARRQHGDTKHCSPAPTTDLLHAATYTVVRHSPHLGSSNCNAGVGYRRHDDVLPRTVTVTRAHCADFHRDTD